MLGKNDEIIQAIITDLSVSNFKRKILPVNCVTILTWNLIYNNKLKKKKKRLLLIVTTNLFNQIILKDIKYRIGHCKWKFENMHVDMKELVHFPVIMIPAEQSIFCQTDYGKQTFRVCATGSDFSLELIYIWKSKNHAHTFIYLSMSIEEYTYPVYPVYRD